MRICITITPEQFEKLFNHGVRNFLRVDPKSRWTDIERRQVVHEAIKELIDKAPSQ